jgi:NIMA (never in mitosis gene a)-related kinase
LVVSEVNILRELRHPFIVRYYDRLIDKAATKLYIVMEYCEGGDLASLIRSHRKAGTAVEEDFVWRVLAQCVAALKECHRHREPAPAAPAGAGGGGGGGSGGTRITPILHRDLKPGNIFLDRARNVKIGDFGLAKELASASTLAQTNVGTPFYMSPEMINEQSYNEKSDIWALGCLLYELCALAPPFDAANHVALAVKINAGKFARVPAAYSDELHRAIRWMLTLDAGKRPAVEDLERLPAVAALARDTALLVREYALAQAAAARTRELRAKEDELVRREAALVAAERTLRAREAALDVRAAELAAAAAAAAARAAAAAGPPPLPARSAAAATAAVAAAAAYRATPPADMAMDCDAGVAVALAGVSLGPSAVANLPPSRAAKAGLG